MTTQTITDSQIRSLRTEASAVGDTAQIALCDVALGEPSDDYSGGGLNVSEQERILSLSADAARAECADAIRAGQG